MNEKPTMKDQLRADLACDPKTLTLEKNTMRIIHVRMLFRTINFNSLGCLQIWHFAQSFAALSFSIGGLVIGAFVGGQTDCSKPLNNLNWVMLFARIADFCASMIMCLPRFHAFFFIGGMVYLIF